MQVQFSEKYFSSELGGDPKQHEPNKRNSNIAVELIIANKFIKLKLQLHSCMIDIAIAKYIVHLDWPPPRDLT
jgi:hypothetical protein